MGKDRRILHGKGNRRESMQILWGYGGAVVAFIYESWGKITGDKMGLGG